MQMLWCTVAFLCVVMLFAASPGWTMTQDDQVPSPLIRALLITGHNNHNWRYTSFVHKDTLDASGRFAVDITESAATALADAKRLEQYQLFVLDYNDFNSPQRWGEAAESNFVDAVRRGTGVLAIHSANNAFVGWTEYEQMLALMWREGTGHGRFHEFDLTYNDNQHPITRGLQPMQRHPDELYHKLVNVHGVEFHTLASAHSSEESGGTGEVEPLAIAHMFGNGRVFATALGHVWTGAHQTKASIEDPQFKILLCRAAEWAATGEVTLGTQWQDVREHNRLTQREMDDGWELLFDGKSAQRFRGFSQAGFPAQGWTIKDETLCHQKHGGGGDLITADQYDDFEFACQWKVESGGNSGIIYRCDEQHQYTWQTGLEMQILDDALHNDGKNPKTRAGTLYALIACAHDMLRPAGQWNDVRIIARGSRIEHWLNGQKVVECDLESDEFRRLREESKFNSMPDFGRVHRGHIALQDHGDEVCFRNIKVRRLK